MVSSELKIPDSLSGIYITLMRSLSINTLNIHPKTGNPSPEGITRKLCFRMNIKGCLVSSFAVFKYANSTPDTIFGLPKTGLANYFAQAVGLFMSEDKYHECSCDKHPNNCQGQTAVKSFRWFHF